MYDDPTGGVSLPNMNVNSIQSYGGNQPHDNIMPCLGLSFIICAYGIYPNRNN
jgi:microcystin-dependent protein